LSEGKLKTLIMVNPVTAPVEMFRYAFLGKGTVVGQYVVISWIITFAVAIVGIAIFNRIEKTFMDTV